MFRLDLGKQLHGLDQPNGTWTNATTRGTGPRRGRRARVGERTRRGSAELDARRAGRTRPGQCSSPWRGRPRWALSPLMVGHGAGGGEGAPRGERAPAFGDDRRVRPARPRSTWVSYVRKVPEPVDSVRARRARARRLSSRLGSSSSSTLTFRASRGGRSPKSGPSSAPRWAPARARDRGPGHRGVTRSAGVNIVGGRSRRILAALAARTRPHVPQSVGRSNASVISAPPPKMSACSGRRSRTKFERAISDSWSGPPRSRCRDGPAS